MRRRNHSEIGRASHLICDSQNLINWRKKHFGKSEYEIHKQFMQIE